jgi:hypothetical protein
MASIGHTFHYHPLTAKHLPLALSACSIPVIAITVIRIVGIKGRPLRSSVADKVFVVLVGSVVFVRHVA